MGIAMSDEKLGIENLEAMISFIVATANAIGRSLEDGDVSAWDLRHFWDPAVLAIGAFQHAGKALKEFDDMDAEEKAEIYDYIDEHFDIDTDSMEPFIQKTIKAAVALGDVVCDIIDRYQDED